MYHGGTGEGVITYFREPKAGAIDALIDAWAPLRWCLFAAPMHAYAGRPVKVEAVLANEDVLLAGSYPVWLRVLGPNGVAWEKKLEVVVPPIRIEPTPYFTAQDFTHTAEAKTLICPGGVAFDRNFTFRYPYFQPGAGPNQAAKSQAWSRIHSTTSSPRPGPTGNVVAPR